MAMPSHYAAAPIQPATRTKLAKLERLLSKASLDSSEQIRIMVFVFDAFVENPQIKKAASVVRSYQRTA